MKIDDAIAYSSEESGTENDGISNSSHSLTDKVKTIWRKRLSKLVYDCTQVGWLLRLNPIITEDAKEHATSEDNEAVEILLFNLILLQTLVGEDRNIKKGRLSHECWNPHKLFQNRDGEHNKGKIWILADKDDCKACEWNQRYSEHSTVHWFY